MGAENLDIAIKDTENRKALELALALIEEAEKHPISVPSTATEAVGLRNRGELPDLLAKSKGVLARLIKHQEIL